MSPLAVSSINLVAKKAKALGNHSFNQILNSMKKLEKPDPAQEIKPVKRLLNDMVVNHEKAMKAVEKSLASTSHSPDKLLSLQYKTGILFLREQMFAKTAELSASTLKNFASMQV